MAFLVIWKCHHPEYALYGRVAEHQIILPIISEFIAIKYLVACLVFRPIKLCDCEKKLVVTSPPGLLVTLHEGRDLQAESKLVVKQLYMFGNDKSLDKHISNKTSYSKIQRAKGSDVTHMFS